jgi:hypothetical protein
MDSTVPVARFSVPLGGQAIELLQVDYADAQLKFLRVRIREGRRFTVFDIDPDTAAAWAEAMLAWAAAHRETGTAGATP